MFKKILIANRGEIAVRIINSCKALGITATVVYSQADANSLHVRLADEAINLGDGPASENYLTVQKVLQAALDSGAEASHPGYGFLSENAGFANAARRQCAVVEVRRGTARDPDAVAGQCLQRG